MYRNTHRAGCGVGVIATILVGDGAQCCLIVFHRIGTTQGQSALAGIPGSTDIFVVKEQQQIFTFHVSVAYGYRGTLQEGVMVFICEMEGGGNSGWGTVFRDVHDDFCRHRWGIIEIGDIKCDSMGSRCCIAICCRNLKSIA